jgi:hypothetical protein
MAVQGDEFHLECFAVAVNVDYCAHVTGLEGLIGQVAGQNDPIMLLNHFRSRTWDTGGTGYFFAPAGSILLKSNFSPFRRSHHIIWPFDK